MVTEQDIIVQLYKHLQKKIPDWFGKKVQKLYPIPNLQIRTWSYILSFTVILEDGQDLALRVKIPRLPDTPTIEHAITNGILQEYGWREYTALQAIYDVVHREPNLNLCAVQVLGYLSGFNAMVMVELPARNLEEMLFDLRMRFGICKLRQRFTNAIIDVGRLLRLYHETIGQPKLESFNGEQFLADVEKSINKLSPSIADSVLDKLRNEFSKTVETVDLQKVTHASLHSDFTLTNIVITPDDCVAVIDMDAQSSWERKPIYLDIARLITDIVVQKVKIRSLGFLLPQRYLDQFEIHFLQGYFGQHKIESRFFALYKSKALLDTMNWLEARIQSSTGISRLLASLLRPKLRSFLYEEILDNLTGPEK